MCRHSNDCNTVRADGGTILFVSMAIGVLGSADAIWLCCSEPHHQLSKQAITQATGVGRQTQGKRLHLSALGASAIGVGGPVHLPRWPCAWGSSLGPSQKCNRSKLPPPVASTCQSHLHLLKSRLKCSSSSVSKKGMHCSELVAAMMPAWQLEISILCQMLPHCFPVVKRDFAALQPADVLCLQ